MHGIIMNQLRLYAEARLGAGGWERLCTVAGVPANSYNLSQNYPDEQTLAIVDALSTACRTERPQLMEDFGQFLVPAVLRVYGSLLRPEWRVLDVLEHTEEVIHTVVRVRNPGATPPMLDTRRVSPEAVQISYTSPRRLCGLARGITRGIARHFQEEIEIRDLECMHQGDARCLILVTKYNPTATG